MTAKAMCNVCIDYSAGVLGSISDILQENELLAEPLACNFVITEFMDGGVLDRVQNYILL